MDEKEKRRLELEIGADFSERTPEEKAERRRWAARWGHVSRRLWKNEPLKGDLLEFALSAIGDETIAAKLKKGEPLTEYEKHLLLEI